MNGTRPRDTGSQERYVTGDTRGTAPQSWPYGSEAPPSQLQLQRQRAASGPQPTFTPAGPRRLAVTAAQPQAPDGAQPRTLQAAEHPAGTFTGLSPWQQWARRAQVRPFPYPGRDTPFYNGMLRDRRNVLEAAAPAAEPFTVAPPLHESWTACQAIMMLPLPGCDYDAYLQAVSRLTETRGPGRQAVAALPVVGADYSDRAGRMLLAGAIEAASKRARPSRARAYMRLREAVLAAWDYTVAEKLVRNADEAGLVSRDDIEAGAR